MRKIKPNYVRAVAIGHGQCEVQIVRYIRSNLKINIQDYSRRNGKNSIEITRIMSELENSIFCSKPNLLRAFNIEESEGKKKKLINFKLYLIMDTDLCSEAIRTGYITKSMFKDHWLYDYIVPIYNVENLEDVLFECGIIPKKISPDEKTDTYLKIFPTAEKNESDEKQIHETMLKLSNSKNTNLNEFMDACLKLLKDK